MQTEFDTLTLTSPEPHLAVVTIDRPAVANALNTQMGLDMRRLWSDLYVDYTAYRCIILTGAGLTAFCAGGDLKERNQMTDAAWQRQHAIFEQAVVAMMNCPVPIIAAVNGAAFGGGCEFALAADFIYAADHARFALTEVTLGIMPGAAGTQNLPRACGVRRAKEIILTGRPFTAAEAHEWGIVNKVCPADELMTEALATARRICANGPISVRQAKKAANMATQTDLATGYAFEIEAYNRMVPTQDRLEGVAAFNEKRKPNFTGN